MAKKIDPLAALKEMPRMTEPAVPPSGHPTVQEPELLKREPVPVTNIAPLKPAPINTKQTSRPSFYFYPDDTSKMRSLMAYVMGQHGIRVNESIVIRAALKLVNPGQQFVEAIEQVKETDRRSRKS